MTIIKELLKLQNFQTYALYERAVTAISEIRQPLLIEGNSILSSVFVHAMDPGASLTIRYFETTTGDVTNERSELAEHLVITPGMLDSTYGLTSKITVTTIHNKPNLEIFVTGGNVDFGIYATVVSSFAVNLDGSLVYDNQLADLTKNKAIVVAGLDENGRFQMLQLSNGKLVVDANIVSTGAGTPLFQSGSFASAASGSEETIFSYTVPTGKTLSIENITASGNNVSTFTVWVDGSSIAAKRTHFCDLNTTFELAGKLKLVAGQAVVLKGVHARPMLGDFDGYIVGVLNNS